MARLEETRKKIEDGIRLSREEGVALLRDADLLELGVLADSVRWRKHPEPVVTYIIDRNINYTNVCTAQCAFCAFYRDLPSKEGYLLSKQQLSQKIEETLALGGRQILLQGGLHPDLGIESSPAAMRRRSVSSRLSFETRTMCCTSAGDSPWIQIG